MGNILEMKLLDELFDVGTYIAHLDEKVVLTVFAHLSGTAPCFECHLVAEVFEKAARGSF